MSAVSLSASPPRALDSAGRLALANTLDAEICSLHRRRGQDLARITTRLAALRESLGYLSLGFDSVQAYAKARVDWGSGKVRSLLELHGRLPRQPLLAAAFAAGEVEPTVNSCGMVQGRPRQPGGDQGARAGGRVARGRPDPDQPRAGGEGVRQDR